MLDHRTTLGLQRAMRQASRAARPWVLAGALAAGGLHACRAEAREAEALPLAVHLGLAEVVVAVRGEGPLTCTGPSDAWDGRLPAALHGALRDAVAAEARRVGLERARTTEVDALPKAVADPRLLRDGTLRPVPATWDDAPTVEDPGVAEPPAPPRPPPGTAWLEVELRRATFVRPAGHQGPALLSATFEATATASVRRGPGDGGRAPAVARQAFTHLDPEPRSDEAWAAGGGAAARAAVERLVERAARRIAQTLLASTSDGTPGLADDRCGLAPLAPRRQPQLGAPAARDEGAVVRWTPWTPRRPRGAVAAVAYDVRAWRLDGRGGAEPVLSADGLSQTAAHLAPPGAPGAIYAWAVRGVTTLPDGRRLTTAWSQARPDSAGCSPEPEPSLADRVGDAGSRAARPPAAPGGPLVAAAYLPRQWTVQRKGLEPNLNAGNGALAGVGYGIKGGLQLSFSCGPFFPLCAVYAVPGGAILGGGLGLVIGGVSSAIEGSTATQRASLAPEPLRSALDEAVGRLARAPALAAGVEEAAGAALGRPGPGSVRLVALEVTLVGEPDPDHRANLWLAVTATLAHDGAAPLTRRVEVSGDDDLPARHWAGDDAAVLAAALRAQAGVAGRRLAAAFAEPEPQPVTSRAPPPRPEDPPPAAEFSR